MASDKANITFQCSKAEKAVLTEAAKLRGMTLSQLIRAAIDKMYFSESPAGSSTQDRNDTEKLRMALAAGHKASLDYLSSPELEFPTLDKPTLELMMKDETFIAFLHTIATNAQLAAEEAGEYPRRKNTLADQPEFTAKKATPRKSQKKA